MRSDVRDYDLIAPSSLAHALERIAEEPGKWTPIAGGTELMVALGAGRLSSRKLLSLAGFKELRSIDERSGVVTIGATTTFTDLRRHPLIQTSFPLLSLAASWTGGIANQNRGTLGGNVANASPAADSSPALLVYDAEITLISSSGTRTLPYRDFHLSYKSTALAADELIHSMKLKLIEGSGSQRTAPEQIGYIRKVGTRNAMAISKVVLAGLAEVEEGTIRAIRLAGASLRDIPTRLYGTERALIGQMITPEAIQAARSALAAEIQPIDDIRSTKAYRIAVAGNLLEEFLRRLQRSGH